MEETNYPAEDSPTARRELQGPRPPRLKLHKDSRMIKKPPLPHHSQHHHQLQLQQQQQQQQLLLQREQIQRQPVVIYTVSPKIIHVKPSDFSAMVQRLTGSSSSNHSANEDQTTSTTTSGGAIVLSPAARLATIERASPRDHNTTRSIHSPSIDETILDGFSDLDCLGDLDEMIMRGGFHGILSPQPSGLPPISPNFFSDLPDPTSLTYFHDVNQTFHADANTSGTSSFIVRSPQGVALINSPSMGQFFDLLNQFLNSPTFQDH
ncbi:hypothetical protein Sjap_018497 [Stephania japonica]|uniref:VQ domain-containing protein n=1 Tax=Stephania japonica TaxID=461633 RepID=A0AAP0NJF8_9MAGN